MQFTSMKTWVFVVIAVRVFIEGAEEFFILPTVWYYIKSLRQTKVFLGIVLAAYSFAAILAGPTIGKLADKFRCTKCIIIFCFMLKVAGNLMYSIPVSAFFPLVGRFISGIGNGAAGVFYGQVVLCTPKKHTAKLAKVFVFFDGMYTLGAAFGPTVSSFLTFDVDIFGWKINAGNCPGIVLTVTWSIMLIVALWLPRELGNDKFSDGKSLIFSDNEKNVPTKQESDGAQRHGGSSTVFCLFYLIFLSLFYSATVTYYTPLLAVQHFQVKFIHVKLLFLTSSMFSLVLFLSLYISAEYFDERKLLILLILMQIPAIAILAYFAFYWEDLSGNETYILIVYVCLGTPYFSYSLGCSLLSKITDPNDAAFYQGSSFAIVHLGYIASRVISGFIFTQMYLLLFCLGLTLAWVVEALWFCLEYQNFELFQTRT